MYARQVEGRTLTLAVSGLLWQSSLVMIDEETESLWSHLLGKAMQGPLEGSELEVIPSAMTDWESWRLRYPATTVVMMSRTANEYRRGLHRNEMPIPVYPLEDALVIGLADDAGARCWRFDSLRVQPVINDRFAGRSIAVVFVSASGTATLFDRNLDGRDLTLTLQDGKLVDEQTQSEWDPITGEAMDKPRGGQQLEKLPGLVSLKRAWLEFYPATTVWSDGDTQ